MPSSLVQPVKEAGFPMGFRVPAQKHESSPLPHAPEILTFVVKAAAPPSPPVLLPEVTLPGCRTGKTLPFSQRPIRESSPVNRNLFFCNALKGGRKKTRILSCAECSLAIRPLSPKDQRLRHGVRRWGIG